MAGRTILFDVDGVVIHGFHARPERRRRWDTDMLRDLGIDPARFSEAFFGGRFERDVLTGRQSIVKALSDVLPTIGFHGSPMLVVDYWLRRDSQLNMPLLDLIRDLRRAGAGPIHLATNQEHLRAFHLWSALGLGSYFDDIFYAARLGVLKPAREFFERIEQAIGPQSEPPLFFDDSETVVAAASAFGWEGVLYDELGSCAAHPWIAGLLAGIRAK